MHYGMPWGISYPKDYKVRYFLKTPTQSFKLLIQDPSRANQRRKVLFCRTRWEPCTNKTAPHIACDDTS